MQMRMRSFNLLHSIVLEQRANALAVVNSANGLAIVSVARLLKGCPYLSEDVPNIKDS